MKLLLALCPLLAAPFFVSPSAPVQDEQDLAEMMKQAERYTKPGPEHELLERFVGEWKGTATILFGEQKFPSPPGSASFKWKIPGRWLEGEWKGELMGTPFTHYTWLGYDKLKLSYVWTAIGSMDTAMNRAEGDLTQDKKSLIMYGTLDEYTTGEHDKMVKYAWRFVSKDEIVLEVHDLPIGEKNTQVLEFRYERVK